MMQKFVRKHKEFWNDGYKIRNIKADLAKIVDLSTSEVYLVYKNLILEDHQRISHYKINKGDSVWFGTFDEYNEEFGEHIVINLKQSCAPDAITVTEMVFVRKSDYIYKIRSYLINIHCWIEKVKFSNINMKSLLDNLTIEAAGLCNNSTIVIGSPILVMNFSSKVTPLRNGMTPKYFMQLGAHEMSEIMEIFRKVIDYNKSSDSIMTRLLNCIRMPVDQEFNVKEHFILLISDWIKYFDREENKRLSKEDMVSMFRQDFGDHLDIVGKNIELSTFHDHLMILKKIYHTGVKIIKKYFPTDISDLFTTNVKSFEQIMDSYLNIEEFPENKEKIVDLRLVNAIHFYLEKFYKEGFRLNETELRLHLTTLFPDILPILCDINSIINKYWGTKFYAEKNKFNTVYVNPNFDKESPIAIMSDTEITVKDAKGILSDKYLSNDVYLMKREDEYVYRDEENLPSDKTISSVSISPLGVLQKIRTLGKGGYGDVSIYKNRLTNQQIVLKKLTIPINKKIEDTTEIMREIVTFSRFGPHKRIIQYLNYYVEKRCFFIEMEYMKEGSLKKYLDVRGPLSEIEIKHFAFQILEGLKYLHDKTIFHRDIKSENVLLDENHDVKLTDFGLAKCFYGSKEDYQAGIKQSRGGTERWIAPEICITGIFGAPSDIWSFGITMIEMITGHPPYPELPSFVAQNIIAKTGITGISISSSSNLKNIVDSCLKINPSSRLTVDELMDEDFFLKINK